MSAKTVLAVDIGAESGRVMAVRFDGQRLTLDECYRFANVPVQVRDTLHWDVLRLWHDVQTGIKQVGKADSIGIDTWAVDFGLIDGAGNLVGNPVHYRDKRTEGIAEWVFQRVPREEVFRQTGIQILPFNSLYQLVSLAQKRDSQLDMAARLLTMPDLLYYWLTGIPVNEFTNATTTQCIDTLAGDWAFDLLDKLEIPKRLFSPVSHPGQMPGKAQDGTPVVLVPHHDTACAVVGVPAQSPNFAYLSSGTWSLLGLELDQPIVNDAAYRLNVTNEGGYGNTTRLLKNIMGLWLLQESRRQWSAAGEEYSYEQLATMAQQSEPFVSLIDPDDPMFLAPGDMPARINAYCRKTGQLEPRNVAAVTRCIFESLALKYRTVLRQLTTLTGRKVDTLHVVGGGALNTLLCQMTADATGCRVVTGPVEATALGNGLVQFVTLGEIESIAQGRALIAESFAVQSYEPQNTAMWDEVDSRFQALLDIK